MVITKPGKGTEFRIYMPVISLRTRDRFLNKPFSPSPLIESIRQVIPEIEAAA